MKRIILLLVFIMLPIQAVADDDTSEKISEIIADLGNNKSNNGKEQKCMNSGTKKITIKRGKDGTTYTGVYKRCKEPGRTRDGHVEITIGG